MNINHQPVSSLESQIDLPNLASLFQKTIDFFAEYLSRNGDPIIWQKFDRNGQPSWVIYDPRTRYSARFDSETEVRDWLEKRFCC